MQIRNKNNRARILNILKISKNNKERNYLSTITVAVYLKLNLRRTFAYNVEVAQKEDEGEREREEK